MSVCVLVATHLKDRQSSSERAKANSSDVDGKHDGKHDGKNDVKHDGKT